MTQDSTDQHQPAAVAPRLSEETEADYLERKWRDDAVSWSMAVEDLKEELDATRADLARARAEADALRTALEQADQALLEASNALAVTSWTVERERAMAAMHSAEPVVRAALAAPHSEPQPAAPVDRSAAPMHQSWCALGRFSYSHCTCGAITPPDHRAGDGDE